MALIKSALELAMERSAGLSVDEKELKRKELITQGRLTAARSMNEEGFDLEKECQAQEKKLSKEEYVLWKDGVCDVFLSRIVLVYENTIPAEINQVAHVLAKIGGRKAEDVVHRCLNVIKGFMSSFQQLKESITQQLGPALKQRAAQMAAQTGLNTRYIMEKDPAYLKVLSENIEPIKAECQEDLDRLKKELRKLL